MRREETPTVERTVERWEVVTMKPQVDVVRTSGKRGASSNTPPEPRPPEADQGKEECNTERREIWLEWPGGQ